MFLISKIVKNYCGKNSWVFDQESESGIVVTEFESICTHGWIREGKNLECTLAIKKYTCLSLLISFKTVSESIYGLETIQNYNIQLIDKEFYGYCTLVEEL